VVAVERRTIWRAERRDAAHAKARTKSHCEVRPFIAILWTEIFRQKSRTIADISARVSIVSAHVLSAGFLLPRFIANEVW